jgi:peptide deformylase
MLVPKAALEAPPLEIHTLGADALRQPAQRIGKVNDQVRELARDMLRSMYTAKGIGLAAPQVAVYQQLLVIDLDLENPATPPLVLINPEITAASAGLDTYEEGCLSIPGVYLDVVRPTAIELSYRDEMGRPRKMKADGLMARCIQHEMDHLNGVLFVSGDGSSRPSEGIEREWFSEQVCPKRVLSHANETFGRTFSSPGMRLGHCQHWMRV